jgi:hypothetical protein
MISETDIARQRDKVREAIDIIKEVRDEAGKDDKWAEQLSKATEILTSHSVWLRTIRPLTQRIIIVWRYVADAVVIILFCGLSALLGIVAAIAFSPQAPPFTLPPFALLFIAGMAGIVIVFALTLAITPLEQRKFDKQTPTPQV